MDLSKIAKIRRDAVEEPLWSTEKLIDDLEDIRVRIDAATAVWPETKSTLKPALKNLNAVAKELEKLQEKLSGLWQQGHKRKWKE